MSAKAKNSYDNESIVSLKGADRVRKRPAVIFGSDGIEGCQHSMFEILSNSIDEAREGYGNIITIRRYLDKSIEVEDKGRGRVQSVRGALQLGAHLLRALRGRKVSQQRRRKLRVQPRFERFGRVRNTVQLGIYGRYGVPRRKKVFPAV